MVGCFRWVGRWARKFFALRLWWIGVGFGPSVSTCFFRGCRVCSRAQAPLSHGSSPLQCCRCSLSRSLFSGICFLGLLQQVERSFFAFPRAISSGCLLHSLRFWSEHQCWQCFCRFLRFYASRLQFVHWSCWYWEWRYECDWVSLWDARYLPQALR